jgi:hypothetical protein
MFASFLFYIWVHLITNEQVIIPAYNYSRTWLV